MEDELHMQLAQERRHNEGLRRIIREHWNVIVRLREESARHQATLTHVADLVDQWQDEAHYARTVLNNNRIAEEIERFSHRLRDTITPPNKE